MTKVEDIIVDGGEISKAKFKGLLMEYAKDMQGEITEGFSKRIVVNKGDSEDRKLSKAYKSFEGWVNRNVDDSWHDVRDKYTDFESAKAFFKAFYKDNDEFAELIDSATEVYDEGGGDDDDQEDSSDGDDDKRKVIFDQLNDVGVVKDDASISWSVLRGTMVSFAKDVDAISIPSEDFDLSEVHSAWNRWMMDKFGKEWVNFTSSRLSPEDTMGNMRKVYTRSDEFQRLVEEKWETDEDELEGNSDSDDKRNGRAPNSIGDWAETEGTTDEVKKTNGRDKTANDTKGIDQFTEEEGTTDTSHSDTGSVDRDDSGTDSNDITSWADKYGSTDDTEDKSRDIEVNRIIQGDSKEELLNLRANTVDMAFTSPPYWGLRDYEAQDVEWADGEWDGQLGHEPHPDDFVDHLVEVFDAVGRVLKKGGVLFVNLDDTYGHGEFAEGRDAVTRKSLGLVPERFVIAMYEAGWIVRNKIHWAKQVVYEDDSAQGAAMPSQAQDRFNENAHEPIYMFVRQQDYYFNLDEVRRPHMTEPGEGKHFSDDAVSRSEDAQGDLRRDFDDEDMYHDEGSNLPTVWQINVGRNDDEHFAAFPEQLVERAVKAACPKDGVVLDPFAGTGTTCKVAAENGRDYLGVELSEKYADIARKNLPDSKQTELI
jgi:site-specific DNA-methyltransferase (adenine-specific)